MSIPARAKSIVGGGTTNTLACATTTAVPDNGNLLFLTGTATITSLTAGITTRNRIVWFEGSSGTQTFTNTTGTTTAGQMDLGGANIVVSAKDVLVLILRNNGVWHLVEFRRNNTAAGSVSTLVSATTLTIPDTANVFFVSGSTTVTALSLSVNTTGRTIRLIGAANASVTFTNTDAPATNGQMYLRGGNRQLLESTILDLQIISDGTSAGTYAILANTTTG